MPRRRSSLLVPNHDTAPPASTPRKSPAYPSVNGSGSRTRRRDRQHATAPENLTPTKRSQRTRSNPSPRYTAESESEEDTPAKKKTRITKEKVVAVERKTANAVKEFRMEKSQEPNKEVNGTRNKTPSKTIRVKAKIEHNEEPVETEVNGKAPPDAAKATPTKRKRKTKEEKEAEAMPLAVRTAGTKLYIGAHVSAAGGVHKAVENAVHIGANAFALFLKSQRKWDNPPIKPEAEDGFKTLCGEHSYSQHSHVLPHGSYLVNLAQKEPEKATQAYNAFLDDLQRCEKLGIRLYNFHPGNTNGNPRPKSISRLAGQLNRAHKATQSVVTVLENMAASPAGNTIGGSFEDLRDVIAQIDDKSRVGVCIDTCHAFAAGYNLRDPSEFKKVMASFDEIVGAKYLAAVHVNDSKAPLGSHRDLHQNIGVGFLGLRAFHNLVNEPRFAGLPLVLETPIDRKDENGKDVEDKSVWAREIKLLESLVGMDAESEEFKKMEAELAEKGAAERAKFQKQLDNKTDKEAKSRAKGKAKAKKSTKTQESGDESESD